MKSHRTEDCILNKNRLVNNKTQTSNSNKKTDADSKVFIINETKSDISSNIEIEVLVREAPATMILDDGSDKNYVSAKAVKDYSCKLEEAKPVSLMFANDQKEVVNKKITETLMIQGRKFYVEFYVLPNLPVNFILGKEFLLNNNCNLDYGTRTLKINKDCIVHLKGFEKTTDEVLDEKLVEKLSFYVKESKEELNKIFKVYFKNNEKFSHIDESPVRFHIKKDVKIVQSRGYSVPLKYLNGAREEIKRLLQEKIIQGSNSTFSSPAFLLKKKNNNLRLVVDYQKINTYIEDDAWILPKIEDCLMEMGSNKIFSQLDLQNGFNQIKLTEDSKQYTAFTLLGNHYEYNRVPFGIKPGPKMFQRQISRILKDIPNTFVYIDDIVVYSQNEEEHVQILKLVLERLYRKRVKINFEKSKFFLRELDVLGYKINSEGIFPKTKSLDTKLIDKPVKTKKDVQRLIGTLNWYRKFIPHLSTRVYKITNLLKNNTKKIYIDSSMHKELKTIEEEIKNNVKLSFPDFSKKFVLECDASDIGLGSVLRQYDKIIGYYSKKLSGSELNYSIVEKEYLEILLSMIYFEKIIQDHYVEILTDGNNCLFDSKKATSRINRWKLLMNEYNYSLIHHNGKENVIADQLSRCWRVKLSTKKNEYIKLVEWAGIKTSNGEMFKNLKNKIMINKNRINEFLRRVHILSGHRGITTLYNNLKDRIFFLGATGGEKSS